MGLCHSNKSFAVDPFNGYTGYLLTVYSQRPKPRSIATQQILIPPAAAPAAAWLRTFAFVCEIVYVISNIINCTGIQLLGLLVPGKCISSGDHKRADTYRRVDDAVEISSVVCNRLLFYLSRRMKEGSSIDGHGYIRN